VPDYGPDVALIVVDVQNDFASPDGGLYVSGGEQVVEVINKEVERARAAGSPVFYTQDWHPPSTPHFQTEGGLWPVHCVRDTWGARLHPDLVVAGPVVRKGTGGEDGYSGFSVRDPRSGEESSTELGDLLREAGVHRIVVTGLAGDVCVKATALDGVRLGFTVSVPVVTTRFVNLSPGDDQRALAELRSAGVQVEPAG